MGNDGVPECESACQTPKLLHELPESSQPISFGNSGVGPNNDEVQDENSLSIGPAQMVIWKGMFDIANITPEGHLCRSCEGFVAHPAAIIARKAFDFSKQISGVIKLKLYPRSHDNLWPEKFQLDPPDWNDIALYFFPGCEESSKKQYAVLLKFMEENNLVLRSLIDHVELLICPSSLFPVDFQSNYGILFLRSCYYPCLHCAM